MARERTVNLPRWPFLLCGSSGRLIRSSSAKMGHSWLKTDVRKTLSASTPTTRVQERNTGGLSLREMEDRGSTPAGVGPGNSISIFRQQVFIL